MVSANGAIHETMAAILFTGGCVVAVLTGIMIHVERQAKAVRGLHLALRHTVLLDLMKRKISTAPGQAFVFRGQSVTVNEVGKLVVGEGWRAVEYASLEELDGALGLPEG